MHSSHTLRGITVVGAGAVGSSLVRALSFADARIDLVVDPNKIRAEAAAFVSGAAASAALDARIAASRVVLVAVPDRLIPTIAAAGAALDADLSDQIWLHTAGALSASALDPIAPKVQGTGGFHPAAAFPPGRVTTLPEGIVFGVDGNEAALAAAESLAELLGGRVVQIPPDSHTLYHATCVLSSNAVIGLIAEAARTLSDAGVPPIDAERLLLTLARGTLDNAADIGLSAALTGPVGRGDVETVSGHLEALEFQKDTVDLYRVTAKAILKSVRMSKVLDEAQLQKLELVFSIK